MDRSGDHVMLDSCSFASFPADPKQVTVRTAACELESRDSRPAELTHQLLEEIRTGMMLNECEVARKTSPDLDAVSMNIIHLFESPIYYAQSAHYYSYDRTK